MESFFISKSGVEKSNSRGQVKGFTVTIIAWNEWMSNPESIFAKIGIVDSELVKEINGKHNKEKTTVAARIITLSPKVYYATYCECEGSLIPFFLTPNELIVINKEIVSISKLDGLAKRGILQNTFDMAKVLGIRVLKQHQLKLEDVELQMNILEEDILKNPHVGQQTKIIELHRKIIEIKKSLNNHLSVFTRLAFTEQDQGGSSWQDLLTDTERELENVRQLHELVEGIREAYQVAMDNRNNDIMKLLTLLATILLPINLLTSFFGMNFTNLPLVNSPIGLNLFYFMSVVIVIVVFFYFRHKRWLK